MPDGCSAIIPPDRHEVGPFASVLEEFVGLHDRFTSLSVYEFSFAISSVDPASPIRCAGLRNSSGDGGCAASANLTGGDGSVDPHDQARDSGEPDPVRHPVRLAEDFGLVDVLSCGRLEIGAGRGLFGFEFDG
jgi:hypothetical protein